jgi:hypothetical protein
MRMLAIEKLKLCPILLIDDGKSSAVRVQGIESKPIMLEHTKPRRHMTGTTLSSFAPSSIQIVTAPEMNMQAAMKNVDTMMRKRLLNFRRSHAFKSDIKKRTTPRNIDETKGSIPSAPTS